MLSKALDEGKEIRVICFDISNLFGKCLVIRLMLKIAHNGLEIIS
jgi:hypothetical protein